MSRTKAPDAPRVPTGDLACLCVGMDQFLMPTTDAVKAVALLSKALPVREIYISGGGRKYAVQGHPVEVRVTTTRRDQLVPADQLEKSEQDLMALRSEVV
jgi:hypothetical protein